MQNANHTGGQVMTCCSHDMNGHKQNSNYTFTDKARPYYRLIITVTGIVALGAVLATTESSFWHGFMQYSMGLYFLTFGISQAVSLKKSAKMFQGYDPLAKALPIYGYILPFVQIGLGIAYLLWLAPLIVNLLAIALLVVNSIGVVKVIKNKEVVRCGCLGEAIDVSVGKVTLLENTVMLVMAITMILFLQTGIHTSDSTNNLSSPVSHQGTSH